MNLFMYNSLLWLTSPFVKAHLKKRMADGKEDANRFYERFGEASRVRPGGQVVWIHAASVGEAMSALPLIQALLLMKSDRVVLLTTGTVTSARLMEDRLPTGAFHQYIPIDTKEAVCRFLDYWQPQIAIWMESEIWPNLINQTAARRIPMLMLNARITTSSFNLWRKTGGLAKKLIKKFKYIHAQSEVAGERLKYLGAEKVEVLGNLKFCSPPLPFVKEPFSILREALNNRKVWLAASTHKGEEAIVAAAHLELRSKLNSLLTIIVPRHPERGDEIMAKLEEAGFNVARRSLGQGVAEDTEIYLADTIGELGLFYRLCDVVFIGGSLVPKGGQNLLEAARLHCAIMHGPDMSNFEEIAEDMKNSNAVVMVKDGSDLIHATHRLLSEARIRGELASKANQVVKSGESLLAHLVSVIERELVEANK
ncbi:MAG: 3-deoxy-D-manno-octulosonic-acid transferase [Sneathiella sp.]|jgi:3-deoxy-D-manno-octulosonic-acid transferase